MDNQVLRTLQERAIVEGFQVEEAAIREELTQYVQKALEGTFPPKGVSTMRAFAESAVEAFTTFVRELPVIPEIR